MQCFNIKEWKLLELQIIQTRHPLSNLQKKCLSSRPPKWIKNSWNVHKIRGAYFQCMNNHCTKFEYKGMKVQHP